MRFRASQGLVSRLSGNRERRRFFILEIPEYLDETSSPAESTAAQSR